MPANSKTNARNGLLRTLNDVQNWWYFAAFFLLFYPRIDPIFHRRAIAMRKLKIKLDGDFAAWWCYKFNLNSLKISYKTHFSTVTVQLFVRKESTYSFKIKFQVSIQKPKLLNYCTACMKMCCLDTKWQNVLCTKFATFVTRHIILVK